MEEAQERYQEMMEEYQEQVEELNEAYQERMEAYQEQVEELNEAYQEQMEAYQEQLEEQEQARHQRRQADREARRAQYQGNPGFGCWPLTDNEYNQVYNEAYHAVYHPAYEKLYTKFAPGTEGFQEKVQKIAQEAAQAALEAVEKARSEKRAAQPEGWKQSAGGLGAWLNSLGREISQAMNGIGAEIGIDLNEAMSDVSEMVNDVKGSIQEIVEDWKQEQAEEAEEAAEDFPFVDDHGSQTVESQQRTENGEYVYTSAVELSAVEKLSVNWSSGQVLLCPWDGEHVEVTEYSRKPLAPEQQMNVHVRDNTRLNIEWSRRKTGWSLFGGKSKRLEVRIPRSLCEKIEKLNVNCISASVTAQNLRCEKADIAATSGSISAQGLTGENLSLHSVSGTIKAENLSAEQLELNTVSGSLKAEGFEAEKAGLHTVSGSLKAHGNAEAFQVSTTSGSAELMVDQCPEKAKFSTVSGSLSITLPENEGFTARYSTMSGGFRTDFPVSGLGGKKGQAVYGSGKTQLEFSSTSGSISVKKAE